MKLFLLLFTCHYSMQNIDFSDSGFVMKPPQPSSAVHGAPPFTGYPSLIFWNIHTVDQHATIFVVLFF